MLFFFNPPIFSTPPPPFLMIMADYIWETQVGEKWRLLKGGDGT